MTWLPARGLSVVLAALFFSLLGACQHNDECRSGEIRCDGDVAMNCGNLADSQVDHLVWHKATCGAGKCKLDTAMNDAFCARETTPDPRCEPQRSGFCEGTTLSSCRAGYVVSTLDCADSDREPLYCVQLSQRQDRAGQSPSAICASEPEPNPLCDDGRTGSFDSCDGDDIVLCQHGYLQARMPCGEGSSCRSPGLCSKYGTPANASLGRRERRATK
jgi:hypothetical protein